jgi:gliding motility-associated-like protein
MRYWPLLICSFLIVFSAEAQPGRKNKKPKVVGQNEISVSEEQTFQLLLSHLQVEDDGWWYPWGYTLRIFEGPGYTLNGNTITPAVNFNGVLSIPVTVHDGEHESDRYHVQISVTPVNDPPVITGQQPVTTPQSTPVAITLNHLTVTDPDNVYPADFQLIIDPPANNNYSVSGNQVTPVAGFEGMLSVSVRVTDGAANSAAFALQIKVEPGNRPPVIVGHAPLSINEDTTLPVLLSHLTVTDPDNTYPTGFTLKIHPGDRYTSAGHIVTPSKDYSGRLDVNVTVHDGNASSAVYSMAVAVLPVNDAPVIANLEENPLPYLVVDDKPMNISTSLEITDADNNNLTEAEISFAPGKSHSGADELLFDGTGPIKGNFDPQRGILKLTGTAPVAEYQKAIRSIRYHYVADVGPPFESKMLYITVSDGLQASEKQERQIGEGLVQVQLDIPTAFTPNGDSANDTWQITPLKSADELNKAVLRVYNKAGYLLYETIGFDKAWDGRLNGEVLPADTYFYTIDLSAQRSRASLKGVVTILR